MWSEKKHIARISFVSPRPDARALAPPEEGHRRPLDFQSLSPDSKDRLPPKPPSLVDLRGTLIEVREGVGERQAASVAAWSLGCAEAD
jgi:hypothetical protein